MARDREPQCKQCRREGEKLFLKGARCSTEKCAIERRNYPPGHNGRGRIRQSEYLIQLREKQRARRYYGVLEKQFRRYYEKASRQPGITGENLLRLLELRLDNVVTRLGFAASRRQGRQLVRHGHILVNGRRVDIPSYQCRPDDIITIKPESGATDTVRGATVAPGRPRVAVRQGPQGPGPHRDRHPGARAAHRGALLEVSSAPGPARAMAGRP